MTKYSLSYDVNISLEDFTEEYKFFKLKEKFYKQSIFGFNQNDIDKNVNISVNEFDSEAPTEYLSSDSAPEIVVKELVKDFLKPVLHSSYHKYVKDLKSYYDELIKYNVDVILNAKENQIIKVNTLISRVKEAKYLAGIKKDVLVYLNFLILDIDDIYDVNRLKDPAENKISLNLNFKELAQFLLVLNSEGFFNKELNNPELARIASIHFKFSISGNYKDFDTNKMRKELSRASNHSESPKLLSVFKNYRKIMKGK